MKRSTSEVQLVDLKRSVLFYLLRTPREKKNFFLKERERRKFSRKFKTKRRKCSQVSEECLRSNSSWWMAPLIPSSQSPPAHHHQLTPSPPPAMKFTILPPQHRQTNYSTPSTAIPASTLTQLHCCHLIFLISTQISPSLNNSLPRPLSLTIITTTTTISSSSKPASKTTAAFSPLHLLSTRTPTQRIPSAARCFREAAAHQPPFSQQT